MGGNKYNQKNQTNEKTTLQQNKTKESSKMGCIHFHFNGLFCAFIITVTAQFK